VARAFTRSPGCPSVRSGADRTWGTGLTEHDVTATGAAEADQPPADVGDGMAAPGAPERVRVRVRRKRRRRTRLRWLWLPIVAGLGLLAVIAGVLLTRDAFEVRRSLVVAQDELATVRAAAGGLELDQASASLARAEAELADARVRTLGPLWSVAAVVPVVGDSIEVTRAVVLTASAAVDVARGALTQGGDLLGGGLRIEVVDDRVDLAPLLAAREVLVGLPLDQLAAARDRLRVADPAWAPEELLDGRLRTLELADETLVTLERGRELLTALPGFLGADGPREYFLGVQTPAELRGTGGLIGYFAVLTIDDGRFQLGASEAYDELPGDELPGDDLPGDEDGAGAGAVTQRIGTLGGDPADGAAVDRDFAAQYGHVAAAGNFSNVNVDPDLTVTAPVALDLFEVRTGRALDGMVLLDQVALGDLLTAVGAELEIPPEYRVDNDLPASVPPEELTRLLTIDLYEELGDERSAERKALLEHLGDAAFAAVFSGGWDGVRVVETLAETSRGRHLQLHSRDRAEQAAFTTVGIGGALQAHGEADLFAVTANNAVGGKQDVHVGHHVTLEVSLDDVRRGENGVTAVRTASVRTELENPLPTSGMDLYIIGNCLVDEARNQCFEGPPGENRTWFTVWTPGDSALLDVRADDGRVALRSSELRGLRVFDRFLETPSRSRSAFEVELDGVVATRFEGGELVYELAWWEQAKAIPTRLDVTLAPPTGWTVVDVEVAGGGDGRGLGVLGDGELLDARVEGGRGRLTGTVNADTTLTVRMASADS
jgi:hypothetical protein